MSDDDKPRGLAQSLPDYHSGATGIPGRLTDGLLLWRSHVCQKNGGDTLYGHAQVLVEGDPVGNRVGDVT